MYNSSIPDPVQTHVTRWRLDPFARGAYSYFAVGNPLNITVSLPPAALSLLLHHQKSKPLGSLRQIGCCMHAPASCSVCSDQERIVTAHVQRKSLAKAQQ